MNKVLVVHGEGEQIAKVFKVTGRTVREALSGRAHSELAGRIRQYAIDRGGVEVEITPKQKIS